MGAIQSTHNYLNQVLCQKSKIDGRFLVMATLLGYFGLLFISSFFTDYTLFWKNLGVPTLSPPFVDLKEVLSGFDCTRLGYDVFRENPCSPGVGGTAAGGGNPGGVMPYPRAWWLLTGLGLGQNQAVFLGVLFAIIFFFLTLIIIGKLNYPEGIIYALILCSPPIMLLVERGNVDIIIYSLLASLPLLINRSRKPIIRFFVYSIILILSILKLFSIFSLTVILKEKKRNFIIFSSFFTTAFIFYYISRLEEMRSIRGFFKVKDRYSYGDKILLVKLKTFLSNLYLIRGKTNIIILIFEVAFALFLLVMVCKIITIIFQDYQLWTGSKWSSDSQDVILSEGQYIDYFRIGSGIYMGTFMLGSVFDYKLAFWILTIPQILAWIKSRNHLKVSSSLALVGIVLSLYLSQFSQSIGALDEIINWFLFGYFLYCFCLSLPQWLKRDIHQLLTRKVNA